MRQQGLLLASLFGERRSDTLRGCLRALLVSVLVKGFRIQLLEPKPGTWTCESAGPSLKVGPTHKKAGISDAHTS
eukprot:6084794-Alexandrium_andersonii.AAC.1